MSECEMSEIGEVLLGRDQRVVVTLLIAMSLRVANFARSHDCALHSCRGVQK
jgi:hypothetical protein